MTGPYGAAAQAYYDGGWSPVTFPFNEKTPPVDGFTGVAGKYVDEVTLRRWLKPGAMVSSGGMSWEAAGGNIALRLPASVVGIDVDMYGEKAGRETFMAAIETWGPLPDTWYTSARDDGSGIRLYRIPEGLAWPGKLPQGGGVELVRWDHRYALVAPSANPMANGARYKWWRETDGVGVESTDEFPDVDDLPELPVAWVSGLTSGKKWVDRPAAEMDADDVRRWLSDRITGPMCAVMRKTLTVWLNKVRTAGDDGGAHDAARDGGWALIGDAAAGHAGVLEALPKLKRAFREAVSRRSDERQADGEWARFVIRGVQKVAAEGPAANGDLCALVRSSAPGSEPKPSGSSAFDYARDDVGNAMRLIHANRHQVRYTEALGGWHIWSAAEGRWKVDGDGEITRRAIEVVQGMEEEAGFIEDPKEKSAFLKFARASGNIGRIKAMIALAADMNDITLPAASWDADRFVLGTPEGKGDLCLEESGVSLHPARQERYVTESLGAAFVSDAQSKVWDKFLAKFLPDEEVRDWVQRLVGYSLQGGNPGRLFVVCFGPSSTGKTTFAEAIRRALGDYAASINLTIFRDNQDERPRADLVRVLKRRWVYAEEASSSWHLHVDQVKRVTGGAPIVARLPFARDYVEMIPAFTPWLLTNAAPTVEGADIAFWRRMRLIPFDVVVPPGQEDDRWARALIDPDGRRAVLAWAVEGWKRYRANPSLEGPASVLPAFETFREGVSEMDSALAEMCSFEEGAFDLPVALYRSYQQWCSQYGSKAESNTKFGRFLSGRGYERVMKKVDGEPRYVRMGLRLNDAWKNLQNGR